MAIDGLASGLDTAKIITSLMAIERIPVNQMEARQAKAQSAIDAYNSILTKMTAVTTAANNLDRTNDWSLSATTSSNIALATAQVSSGATTAAGSLTFTVSQLAAAHTLTSAQVADRTTSMTTGGSSTISLTVAGTTTSLSVGSGSIDEIASAVNNAGLGVRATVVNTGSGFRLQMSSASSGAASTFDLAGLDAAYGAAVTSQGRDAQLTIGEGANAYSVTSSTNTFSELVSGITITAKAVSNEAVTISVERDGKALAERVKALATSVNDALAEIKKQTAFNAATSRGSTLSGDAAARQATQALTRALTDAVAQSPLGSAGAAGISVDRNGAVQFDEAKFLSAYNADPTAVERLFVQGSSATSGGSASSAVSLTSAGALLAAGSHQVVVTQAATQASQLGMVGQVPITNPATIRVKLNGVEIVMAVGYGAGNDIDLTNGPADAATLAGSLNTKLQVGGFALQATASGGGIEIRSNAYGSGTSFDVSWDDIAGSPSYTSASGTDVIGTINGQSATGVGQTLSLATTNGQLSGLSVRTTQAGTFDLTYEPGIAQRLLGAVNNAVDKEFGYLAKAKNSRETQITNFQKSIDQYQIRLDARELRLKAQFAALETLLSSMNATGSMVSSMTAGLNSNNSK
ncbi:MAG: flagellar filament capping protein FliD [Microthrixaceae bacterium]|nr:flagellar filament capping protein FliD [Microthrixaceae bacterium]